MIVFNIYITIDKTLDLFEDLHHFHFCSNCLVQFCIILVRNGMFYEEKKSSNVVTIFTM